jgi:hypothetical protein
LIIAQRVRDWELMLKYANNTSLNDPFCISNIEGMIQNAMSDAGLITHEIKGKTEGYTWAGNAKIGPFQQRNKISSKITQKALGNRLLMAIIGGIALILPMILMVKLPTTLRGTNADLIITSVSAVSIAFLVALFSEVQPEGVIAIVAAHAAVLVVFVGTSIDKKS